jgi:hypothetical protein
MWSWIEVNVIDWVHYLFIYGLFKDLIPDRRIERSVMNDVLNSTWKGAAVACVKVCQDSPGGTEEEHNEPTRTFDVAILTDYPPNKNQKY